MKAFFLIVVVATFVVSNGTPLLGQDRYPLLFESSTIPDGDWLYQQASRESTFAFDGLPSLAPQIPSNTGQSSAANSNNGNSGAASNSPPPPPKDAGTNTPPKMPNSLTTNRFNFQNWSYGTSGHADYVVPGRLYVGDNNSAETLNRIIVRTNYFNNALDNVLTDGGGATTSQNKSVNQFLVGFEKTLDKAEQWSLEMRLPIFGSDDAVFADGFSTQNFSVGNIAMILKRQLFEDEYRIFSAGLGLTAPTGNDTSFIAGEELFTVSNDATYVTPFLAGLWTPNDKWFYHSFLTVDVPTSSNTVEYRDLMPCGCPGGVLGEQTNQTLLNFDFAAGYWWFRDRDQNFVRAMSSMIQLNYMTPLNDADVVSGNTPHNYVEFTSKGGNNFDNVNLGASFDFNIVDRFTIRFGTVAPINDGLDRFFDSEWQVSVNFLR